MLNRFKKNSLKVFGSIILITAISLTGLSGCGLSKETATNKGSTMNTGDTAAATPAKAPESTLQNTTDRTNKGETAAATSTAVPKSKLQDTSDETDKAVSKANAGESSLAGYVSLLGLGKDELAATLNEKPVSVGEGGLEFKKAGIRVWFDGTSASQIFT